MFDDVVVVVEIVEVDVFLVGVVEYYFLVFGVEFVEGFFQVEVVMLGQ